MTECNSRPVCDSFHQNCPNLKFHKSTNQISLQSETGKLLDLLASLYSEAATLITNSKDSKSIQQSQLISLMNTYDSALTAAKINFNDEAVAEPTMARSLQQTNHEKFLGLRPRETDRLEIANSALARSPSESAFLPIFLCVLLGFGSAAWAMESNSG